MHKITVKDFPYLDFGDIRRDERFVSIINNISTQPGNNDIGLDRGLMGDTRIIKFSRIGRKVMMVLIC